MMSGAYWSMVKRGLSKMLYGEFDATRHIFFLWKSTKYNEDNYMLFLYVADSNYCNSN